MSLINNVDDNVKVVEVLTRALGVMIMEPQYENDPANIGKKLYAGNIQKPILEGDNRQVVIDKLIETIKVL